MSIYAKYIKRILDFVLSFFAILVLSLIILVLAIIGAIAMKGNPFFVQKRPGKIDPKTGKERIFSLVKFRTMTCEKDKNGNLLPDEKRITGYGEFLRKTSLDELPELFNIFIGDMSIVGPRPLLVQYLPLYTEEQRHRHDVRPGLTGYAQVNGRNLISWDDKFKFDNEYIRNISFIGDIKIVVQTVLVVFKREGISSNTSVTIEPFTGSNLESEKETSDV